MVAEWVELRHKIVVQPATILRCARGVLHQDILQIVLQSTNSHRAYYKSGIPTQIPNKAD